MKTIAPLSIPAILAFIIEKSKEALRVYKTSALKAFNSTIINSYFFYDAHFNRVFPDGKKVGRSEYFGLFYDLALNSQELPEAVRYFVTRYYYPSRNNDTEADSDFLNELRIEISDERKRIAQLEDNACEIVHILHKQCISQKVQDSVKMLVEWAELHELPTSLLYLDIFNCGYIEGVRAERARRKSKKEPAPSANGTSSEVSSDDTNNHSQLNNSTDPEKCQDGICAKISVESGEV